MGEVPGLSEEIAKAEFANWSAGDLSEFINEPSKPLPSLKQPTAEDLRWMAAAVQLKTLCGTGLTNSIAP
jgi:hypothetical protein